MLSTFHCYNVLFAGRCISILQEKKHMETKLWKVTLTFLAVTLTTEGQRISSSDENVHSISNILDSRIPSSGNFPVKIWVISVPASLADYTMWVKLVLHYHIYYNFFFSESDMSVCSGTSLCHCLIKLYDAVALRPHPNAFPVKQLVANALKSVFGLSETAKISAMEGKENFSIFFPCHLLWMSLNSLSPCIISQTIFQYC